MSIGRYYHYFVRACDNSKTTIWFSVAMIWCLLSFSLPARVIAQSTTSVLANRISKTWRMEKLEELNKSVSNDPLINEFMLDLHPDHVVEQGMNPDGLIKGTWSVDEASRILSVKDIATDIVYKMKILKLSDTELILQEQSGTSGLTIYYKAK